MNRFISLFLVITVFSISCVSTSKAAPDWVTNTPKPDGTFTYFVGFASDPNGNKAQATINASNVLIAEIMKYIGVEITSNTSATAKASLDSYKTELESSVTSKSENTIAGFSIASTYSSSLDNKTVYVYVLGQYRTDDLEKEKKKIQAQFQKKIDAVAVPEAEGIALMNSGRPFEAVRKFSEAAAMASKSDIANASIYFEENINNAKEAVSKIRFVKSNDIIETLLGSSFSKPIKVRLVYGENDSGLGIPNANIAVTYPIKQNSGRIGTKTEYVLSDAQGYIVFTPPTPDYIGKQKIIMRLDFKDSILPLRDIDSKYENLRQSFVEAVSQKFIEIEFTVISNAKNVSTGVSIVDLDELGMFSAEGISQNALIEALTKEKFKVRSVNISTPTLMLMAQDDIISEAKAKYGSVIKRLVFGTVKIDSVKKDGYNFVSYATAIIKVIDLSTGEVLYSKQLTTVSFDTTEQGSRNAAYKELGLNLIGRDILNNLP